MMKLPLGYPLGQTRAWQRRAALPPIETAAPRLLLLGGVGSGLRQGALQAVLLKAQQEQVPTLLLRAPRPLRRAAPRPLSLTDTLLCDYGLPVAPHELRQGRHTAAWLHVQELAEGAALDVPALWASMAQAGERLLVIEGLRSPLWAILAAPEASTPVQVVVALEDTGLSDPESRERIDGYFEEQLIYLERDELHGNLPRTVKPPAQSPRGLVYHKGQGATWLHHPPMLPHHFSASRP